MSGGQTWTANGAVASPAARRRTGRQNATTTRALGERGKESRGEKMAMKSSKSATHVSNLNAAATQELKHWSTTNEAERAERAATKVFAIEV